MAPRLGKREILQKMTHLDSFMPPFLKSVQYKKMLAILMCQHLGHFPEWAHTGKISMF